MLFYAYTMVSLVLGGFKGVDDGFKIVDALIAFLDFTFKLSNTSLEVLLIIGVCLLRFLILVMIPA